MVASYGRAHGIAPDRVRRWMTTMVMIGALDRVQACPSAPLFLIKAVWPWSYVSARVPARRKTWT